MANFKVDIGKLDKRITIQKYDKNLYKQQISIKGFPTIDAGWEDFKTVWSSINNLFGREFYAAKAVNEENTKNFIIRYSKDLADLDCKNYRIIYKNKTYDITFVDNIEEQNKFYKVKAKVVN
jgi:SPP1 family predicted phage head-tail adaptor